MDTVAYFDSLTEELHALKNRIRNFIGNAHWLSDGEWKESILRSILRRYLPTNIGVGNGFIITNEGPSTQIDILIYDSTKPILFKDGDFILVTPDATLGVIEVKTRLSSDKFREALQKIDVIAKLHRRQPHRSLPFYGLFVYDDAPFNNDFCLETLKSIFSGFAVSPIDILTLGDSRFVRFWYCDPQDNSTPVNKWHLYEIKNKAPAYFLHNVIAYTCNVYMGENELWFPKQSKEVFLAGTIEMNQQLEMR